MKPKNNTLALPNNRFLRILGIPALILSIPFILQFNWDETDFLFMGALLVAMAFLFEFAWKKAGKHKIAFITGIVLFGLWLYVELAVGLFTNWGS